MLKLKYYLPLLVFSSMILSSCSKDDDRDQFVGTWRGTQTISINELGFSESYSVTQTISKSSTNDNQIIFLSPESQSIWFSDVSRANVNGNAFTYEDYSNGPLSFSLTETSDGVTIGFIISGGGSINGSVITEQGTLIVSAYGETYNGTWSGTMNLQ